MNIPCNATIMIDDNIACNYNACITYVAIYAIQSYSPLAGVQTMVPMLGVLPTGLTKTQMLQPLVNIYSYIST